MPAPVRETMRSLERHAGASCHCHCRHRALDGETSASSRGGPPPCPKRRARAGRSAPCEAPRNAGPVAARVSALRRLTRRSLFEWSERSERSELRDGPRVRVPQGSRCAAPTAEAKRCGLPGRAFAASTRACKDALERQQWAESSTSVISPVSCDVSEMTTPTSLRPCLPRTCSAAIGRRGGV